ncbi:MAG: PRC-barrel domain-containing protein [Solirubrobacteraceae bacterium]|jgi:sporulation protein YlmC with PRC-barrel domain
MSERFAAATGRKMVSRASAEELGELAHIVVDVERRRIASLTAGKRRKALLVDWKDVSGFGPDAVIVTDESALHSARDDHERAAVDGKLDLLGKRALSEMGDDLGPVTDVVFDAETGVVETLILGDHEEPVTSLLGAGSFAAIFRTQSHQ